VVAVAAANGSAQGSGGRSQRGQGSSDGRRPSIGIGGRRTWIQVPLSWPIVLVMVLAAVARWAIRWRFELALLAGAAVVAGVLSSEVGWHLAVLLLVWLVVAALAHPRVRGVLIAHTWCMVSRHRVRTALGQAGVSSREGRLPYVIRVRRTPVGTRVTVWMRAGTAMEQFGDDASLRIGVVRAACWAREVRLERHPRWSHLVTLHLVRHDSLAPSVSVRSELVDLLNAARGAEQTPPAQPAQPVVVPVHVPSQATGRNS
jgi:hypothetical protein